MHMEGTVDMKVPGLQNRSDMSPRATTAPVQLEPVVVTVAVSTCPAEKIGGVVVAGKTVLQSLDFTLEMPSSWAIQGFCPPHIGGGELRFEGLQFRVPDTAMLALPQNPTSVSVDVPSRLG
jgi:hypothetical protein